MTKRPSPLVVVLLLVSLFALAEDARAASKTHPPLKKTASFGDYTANTYYDQNSNTKDAYYEILKNKKSIYTGHATENGEKIVIGTLYKDDPDASLVTMGKDITGDGQPDLVISEWTGGANCCLIFHIFEIGSKFRKIADIDAQFGDQGPHFVQLTKGPGLQIQIYDWTFANWNTDFADSPAPKVILQYAGGTYVMAPELMRTPSADLKDVAAKIVQIKTDSKGLKGSWPDAKIPPELWAEMLDLIYTGHRIVAWQFLHDAWPPTVSGKEKFLDDFMTQLKKSPYWKEVAKLAT